MDAALIGDELTGRCLGKSCIRDLSGQLVKAFFVRKCCEEAEPRGGRGRQWPTKMPDRFVPIESCALAARRPSAVPGMARSSRLPTISIALRSAGPALRARVNPRSSSEDATRSQDIAREGTGPDRARPGGDGRARGREGPSSPEAIHRTSARQASLEGPPRARQTPVRSPPAEPLAKRSGTSWRADAVRGRTIEPTQTPIRKKGREDLGGGLFFEEQTGNTQHRCRHGAAVPCSLIE